MSNRRFIVTLELSTDALADADEVLDAVGRALTASLQLPHTAGVWTLGIVGMPDVPATRDDVAHAQRDVSIERDPRLN